jgi:hypothetical protein
MMGEFPTVLDYRGWVVYEPARPVDSETDSARSGAYWHTGLTLLEKSSSRSILMNQTTGLYLTRKAAIALEGFPIGFQLPSCSKCVEEATRAFRGPYGLYFRCRGNHEHKMGMAEAMRTGLVTVSERLYREYLEFMRRNEEAVELHRRENVGRRRARRSLPEEDSEKCDGISSFRVWRCAWCYSATLIRSQTGGRYFCPGCSAFRQWGIHPNLQINQRI